MKVFITLLAGLLLAANTHADGWRYFRDGNGQPSAWRLVGDENIFKILSSTDFSCAPLVMFGEMRYVEAYKDLKSEYHRDDIETQVRIDRGPISSPYTSWIIEPFEGKHVTRAIFVLPPEQVLELVRGHEFKFRALKNGSWSSTWRAPLDGSADAMRRVVSECLDRLDEWSDAPQADEWRDFPLADEWEDGPSSIESLPWDRDWKYEDIPGAIR